MQSISRHKFDLVFCARLNDVLAFLLGYGQGLFTEHMHSSLGRAHGKLAMQVVGKGDIDSVYLAAAQTEFVILIRISVRHAIPPSQLPPFGGVIGNERREPRIGSGMSEGG
jgi:hypothetical protein